RIGKGHEREPYPPAVDGFGPSGGGLGGGLGPGGRSGGRPSRRGGGSLPDPGPGRRGRPGDTGAHPPARGGGRRRVAQRDAGGPCGGAPYLGDGPRRRPPGGCPALRRGDGEGGGSVRPGAPGGGPGDPGRPHDVVVGERSLGWYTGAVKTVRGKGN